MGVARINVTGIVVLSLIAGVGLADTVDLYSWTAESYPAVAGFGAGVWTVAPGGDSVTQSVNGQPTLFYSDFNARGTDVRGTITKAAGASDDDYIGFALGFRPGDTGNSVAAFLLVDWKQATQSFDFGAPSTTPGSTAQAGLAVSQVTGVPTADELWGHTDFASDAGGGVSELAQAANLGNVGYSSGAEYDFRFVFQAASLQVYVDDVLELDIGGSFPDGRLAFYNFSQAGVTYSAFTLDEIPEPRPIPVPGPASLPLVLLGVAGVLARRCRQGRSVPGS